MKKTPNRNASSSTLNVLAILAMGLAACADPSNADDKQTQGGEEAALRSRPPRGSGGGGGRVAGGSGGGGGMMTGGAGGAGGSTSPPFSPNCPNGDGSCPNGLACADSGGQYSCVAPQGSNLCMNGQVCPVGTVCGSSLQCNSEEGLCFHLCFGGGQVVVYDGAVGGPCQSVDVHGVLHVCSSALCSGGSPSVCLPPSPPPPPPPTNG